MEATERQPFEEQEIDLLEVFHVLWSKAWLLLVSAAVGALATGVFTFFFIAPKYEATSIIYILSKTTSITSLTDLQIGSQLAADFQIIATTREVVEPVKDQFGITDPYEDFIETVEVANPADSHMLQITVTNEDPELAAQLSNALADQLKLQIAEVMSTDTPSTVQRAVVPEEPSSPKMLLVCVVGGLVCFVLMAGILLAGHFMDDTIKDEEDVEKYLGQNVLAALPLDSAAAPAKTGRGSAAKRKGRE